MRISNSDTKAAAYSSLVRFGLEYCAAVWSPHTDKLRNKLEMAQIQLDTAHIDITTQAV